MYDSNYAGTSFVNVNAIHIFIQGFSIHIHI